MGSIGNLHSLFGENDKKSTMKFRNLYQIFWGVKGHRLLSIQELKETAAACFLLSFIAFGAICDKFDGIIDNPVHFSELGERRQSGPSIGTLMLVVTLRCSNSYTNDSNQRYS